MKRLTEDQVRERPILFSGPMVRAILDGHKTQTRRVVKMNLAYVEEHKHAPASDWAKECPYGQPGDRLWVRETWRPEVEPDTGVRLVRFRANGVADDSFPADLHTTTMDGTDRWRPSIHMPRWASRLTLEVTAIRVERLQQISEDDALAEGADGPHPSSWHPDAGEVGPPSYREGFRELWDSINAKRGYGWDINPWVWVVEFAKVGP